jgi:tetratricopeptide (TPR) repeat protein
MGMHAYEEAATEYRRALQVSRFTDPDGTAHCELLLRLGEAQARAGDYRAARESCLQAAELARRLGAAEQFARAALVFGEPQVEGGLVNRQLVALLQAALDGLSSTDSPLRARLLARLSLELTFSDETERTESLSRQAVEMARRLGDVASLGTALRTRWMAVWGPHGRDERAALASEMLELAQATGDRELELLGRARRAASSLESGDVRALEADIAAHTRLADEFRMPVHQWTTTTMRAMRALLRGSFEEAERLVEAARSLQPGRPNAQFAHFDQVTLLWWEQGRLAELREAWQGFAERFPEAAFAVGWRSLADAELGDTDAVPRGCGRWPASSPSCLGMACGSPPWRWGPWCPRT